MEKGVESNLCDMDKQDTKLKERCAFELLLSLHFCSETVCDSDELSSYPRQSLDMI